MSHSGERSIAIHSSTPNDVRWIQTVNVQPHTLYQLSGWIPTVTIRTSSSTSSATRSCSTSAPWGVVPLPEVSNHADTGEYVNCQGGPPYVWVDESQDFPIPNSIYNNHSGFTHDYYSGTIATVDQPTRCLGITPQAWSYGGPVTG